MGFKIVRTTSSDPKPAPRDYGKHSFWYVRVGFRSVSGVIALVETCVYAAACTEYMGATGWGISGLMALEITAPALSFLVNLTALIILYRTRRNNIVHAGWILTLDLLTTLLLVMHTLFAEYTFNDDVTGQNSGVKEAFVDLQAVWILGLILCVFQFVSFIIDIRDTHVRRRVDREYAEAITMKQDPNFADPERQAGLEDVELKDRLVVGVRDNQIAEASGSVRVEVPDSGRAELHASHKVEMPDTGKAELHSSHKVELPAIRTLELPMDYAGMGSSRQVSPIELPTPDSVANGWQKDKTSVRSFA